MYAYNRSAFQNASKLPNPLIAVYASMVHLELALKASNANLYKHKHDVCAMLDGFGRVAALVVQLRNNLRCLRCTSSGGKPDAVPHDNYPAIRYLRHADDHDDDASDDDDLRRVAGILDDIKRQLRKNQNMRSYL